MFARRVYEALPERVRAPLREMRHGEHDAQRRAAGLVRRGAASVGLARGGGDLLAGPWHRPRRATVVDRFDAWAERDDLIDALVALLDEAGIECVLPPLPRALPPVVAIADRDAARAAAALAGAGAARDWWVADLDAAALPSRRRPAANAGEVATTAAGLLCYRLLASPNGIPLSDEARGVRLEFWHTVNSANRPRPDGETFEVGSRVACLPNAAVAYLQPIQWRSAAESPTHWLPGAAPDLRRFTEPIDIVYTWVDGDDPAWRQRKVKAQGGVVAGEHNADSLAAHRFISRDELKFSLRSVEMFASWVNHVWIVTDRQVPPWLDTDNSRVTVVDHREIFTDANALPVFNSHAIESQLHHIPGLAEHYLYLNDDMFFGRPVYPELFFVANGISRFFPSTAVLDVTPRSARDLAVASAGKRNRELIERDFGRVLTNKLRHTPQPQTRAVLEEMESRYPEMFDSVMRSRFRHPDDYAIPSALSQWYAFATSRAVDGRLVYGYQDIAAPDASLMLAKWRRRRALDCFCLNDTSTDAATADSRDRVVDEFLRSYFPVPSSFEKDTRGV